MDWRFWLDARPVVVALAGSNGAGKSTFFQAHLPDTGLRFVNADDPAVEMGLGAYEAAERAASLRACLVEERESFVFETVLSDPVGAKVAELVETGRHGTHVVLIFIRIDSPETSKQRVAMRVMQGGCKARIAESRTKRQNPLPPLGLQRVLRKLRRLPETAKWRGQGANNLRCAREFLGSARAATQDTTHFRPIEWNCSPVL